MNKRLHKIMHNRVLGFTLAEVLVTLVIIGTIAALTIPALVNNVQKAMWVEAMKKTHSSLVQATSEIMLDNGGTMAGVFTDLNSMMNIYNSKMGFVKTCLAGQNAGVCFHDGTNSWYNLRGEPGWQNHTVFSRAIGRDGALYAFNLNDPSCRSSRFKIHGVDSQCGWIEFDANGFKGPNTMGRDIFEVEITSQGIYFDGAAGDIMTSLDDYCNPASTASNFDGIDCGTRIMQEGGMNY